jgi:hypothetical protein
MTQIELESEAAQIKEYVDRVGSAFANAVYSVLISHQYKRLDNAERRLKKIKAILEDADLDLDFEDEFDIACELRINQIWGEIKKQEAQRDLILSFGPIVGDNPGTQENLDSLGINARLRSLDEIFAFRD